jgi:hypothetical protein
MNDQFGAIPQQSMELAGAYGEVREGRLFGPGARGIVDHKAIDGFMATQRNASLTRTRRVNEAAKLYADVLNGRLEPEFFKQAINPRIPSMVAHLMENYGNIYRDDSSGRILGLRETMSVSDYQSLYVDVLDRIYYGYYNDFPIVNKPMVRMHQLRDFRLVSRYILDGMVTPMTAIDPAAPGQQTAMSGPVPQDGATFPTTNTAPLQYAPLLYQALASVNWSAFVNDDLGIFKDVAIRLAIQANRAIAQFITSKFVDVNGPNALLYTTGYKNKVVVANGAASANPPLGVQGIVDALKVLAGMLDSSGQPIMITGKMYCFYAPANYAVAMNLKNQLSVFLSNEGGGANTAGFPTQFLQVNNWAIQNMEFIMDPYIPVVCTTSGIKNTLWGIVVDPASQNRPAVEIGMLNGFETPQMFQRVPNTQRMGGGVDQMMGNFDNMNQDTKIVTVMGGTQIDGRSTVASTGAGV